MSKIAKTMKADITYAAPSQSSHAAPVISPFDFCCYPCVMSPLTYV